MRALREVSLNRNGPYSVSGNVPGRDGMGTQPRAWGSQAPAESGLSMLPGPCAWWTHEFKAAVAQLPFACETYCWLPFLERCTGLLG